MMNRLARILTMLLLPFGIVLTAVAETIELHSQLFTTRDGLANNTVRSVVQDSTGFIWLATVNGVNRYDGNSFVELLGRHGNMSGNVSGQFVDRHGFVWMLFSDKSVYCYDPRKDTFVFDVHIDLGWNNNVEMMEAANGDVWIYSNVGRAVRVAYKDGKHIHTDITSAMINRVKCDADGTVTLITDNGLHFCRPDANMPLVRMANFSIVATEGNVIVTKSGELRALDGRLFSYMPHRETVTSDFCIGRLWYLVQPSGVSVYDLDANRFVADRSIAITGSAVSSDGKGNYCLYNRASEFRLVLKDGTIRHYTLKGRNDHYRVTRVSMRSDSNGRLWIADFGAGLFCYDAETDCLSDYSFGQGHDYVNTNMLTDVYCDSKDNIWLCTEASGLLMLTPSAQLSTRILPFNETSSDANAIRMIDSAPDGKIRITTKLGRELLYDASLQHFTVTSAPPFVYTTCVDAKGRYWKGTKGSGLFVDGRQYQTIGGDTLSLSHNEVYKILRDGKDRIWVATYGGGLNLAYDDNGEIRFRHYLTEPRNSAVIYALACDQAGRLWAGTNEGIAIVNPDNPETVGIHSVAEGKGRQQAVVCLFLGHDGTMWLGTKGNGLVAATLSGDSLNLTHYHKSDGLADEGVQAIIEDSNHQLWVSTQYGLSRFDATTRHFDSFFFSTNLQRDAYNENSAILLSDGRLAFGSNDGIVVVDPSRMANNSHRHSHAVAFTSLYVNGALVMTGQPDGILQRSITYKDTVSLAYNQNTLRINFSSFNYGQSSPVLYTYRIDGLDDSSEWSLPTSDASMLLRSLSPGTYRLHVKSRVGASQWGDESLLTIIVRPPFYATPWAYIIYAISAILLLWVAIRTLLRMQRLRMSVEVERQLTEYKLRFFTNISHEFRTPLTLIQGASEKLDEQPSLTKETRSYVQLIKRNSDRLSRLANQLLEFRKMGQKKLQLRVEPTDVVLFCSDVADSFQEMASDKQIDYKVRMFSESFTVLIDREKTDKILYNLLSNAFKYTPQGGSVSLDVERDADNHHLVIRVTDTGVGISKEKQQQLFSRFMQTEFSADSIGIGLNITKELVLLHHGTIAFEENPDGGSVFIVTLPDNEEVYSEAERAKDISSVSETSEQETADIDNNGDEIPQTTLPLNEKRVLVIEDDTQVSKFLSMELGKYFTVETRADGEQGLAAATEMSPDLIVCDVMMPKKSGFEVVSELKRKFETCHIPVILLTALGQDDKRLQGIDAGADAYMTKPFSMKMLLTRIIRLIEQREQLRQKFTHSVEATPSSVVTTQSDRRFLDDFMQIFRREMGNADFLVDDYAREMALSRTLLYNKMKGIVGIPPKEYINLLRLKEAARQLREEGGAVSDVAYRVGYNDPHYFSKAFKQQFGESPTQFVKK